MAVIDLFTCMVIIPFTMLVEFIDYNVKYDFFCKLYHFLIASKVPLSAFIMVAIAFDRYFCICHPLKRVITLRRVKYTMVYLSLLACVLGLITSLFYSVYQVILEIDSVSIDREMGINFTKSITEADDIKIPVSVSGETAEGVPGTIRPERYNELREKLVNALKLYNYSYDGTSINAVPCILKTVYTGTCSASSVILDETFFKAYHPFHISIFPLCLITVIVLYFLIYRFMCLRRSKKLQQKLIMCSYVNGDGTYENTRLVSGVIEEKRRNSKNGSASSIPGTFPVSVSAYDVSPSTTVIIRSSTSCHTAEQLQGGDGKAGKHGAHLQVEAVHKSKLSFTPANVSSVTPTEHEDNLPILDNFYSTSANNNNNFSNQTSSLRRHSHLPEQKYHWHKNRDSMKRYKGKSKRRRSQHSLDVDRLRDENRAANVRTALMLFTVTIVFVIAFLPSMLMSQRIVDYQLVPFYIYFSYNVANPFIYAFMNHIFKDYMRKMFSCPDLTRRSK